MYILTWKCARRALFRHRNFQKWSEREVFSFFNCKCASRHNGVHFFDISTSKSGPNMVCFVLFCIVLCLLTWKCALRHNGVQFFISHLPSGLCTRRFSEPTFDPPEPQIIGKTQCFATFPPFRAPGSSFF